MRTTVIIEKRGEGYVSTVSGKNGVIHKLVRCGLNPDAAAFAAARLMLEYAVSNDEGGDLMAPAEVLDMVPNHLRRLHD